MAGGVGLIITSVLLFTLKTIYLQQVKGLPGGGGGLGSKSTNGELLTLPHILVTVTVVCTLCYWFLCVFFVLVFMQRSSNLDHQVSINCSSLSFCPS